MTTTEFAPAKVNLCLHVTGRREDGYHLLDSVAVFAGVGDGLTGEAAAGLTLEVGGAFGAGLTGDNLVLRAARLLAARVGGAGARLRLEKRLPVASGIGGGSADAAAALRLLGRLWGAPASLLAEIAPVLGADVPVCLAGDAARMRGVGDVLDAARVPEFGMVLVNPGIAVATPAVFRAYADGSGAFSAPLALPEDDGREAWLAWLATVGNDLQAPAVGLCPVVGDVLAALGADPACRLARMSGSGATCYGLYDDAGVAERAATALRGRGWWCWGGKARRGKGKGSAPGAR